MTLAYLCRVHKKLDSTHFFGWELLGDRVGTSLASLENCQFSKVSLQLHSLIEGMPSCSATSFVFFTSALLAEEAAPTRKSATHLALLMRLE